MNTTQLYFCSVLLFCFISFVPLSKTLAQTDTEFWFAAPEITQGVNNYDRPVAFWVSTYQQAAVVTLSQPANPNFIPQVLNLQPNSTGAFTFPPFFDQVENTPPNTVLNKGFLIQSSALITAYYEVLCQYETNPEIFSLKGRNALGTSFFVPFQTLMRNSNAYQPLPSASFDIVASENGTVVNILPSANLVGHSAGVTFTVNLQKGQTYCAQAASQQANGHPGGSKVTSNKPIAITIKDDLLEAGILYGGGMCRDMIGDQVIPVERIGKRYILQKGLLNSDEHGFVFGTQANTLVKVNGVTQGLISAGEELIVPVPGGITYIESDKPVYVLQVTGNGCEVGGEVLPAMDCTGSSAVRFIRPDDEEFLLFLSTKTGNETGFSLNGNPNLLPAGNFQPVPGSNGEFVAATFALGYFEVPVDFSSIVENSKGVFHMGFLNGGNITGCRYGYFSDYSNQIITYDTTSICSGDTTVVRGLTIPSAGNYQLTIPNPSGCDSLFKITALQKNFNYNTREVFFCEGTSIVINGQTYNQNAFVLDTIFSNGIGCDTIITFDLHQTPFYPKNETIYLCYGDTLTLNNNLISEPATITDTILAGIGCDTLLTTKIEWFALPMIDREIVLCEGTSIEIGGIRYDSEGIVTDTIRMPGEGCDSVRITQIKIENPPQFLPPDTVICLGDRLVFTSPYANTRWNGTFVGERFDVLESGPVYVFAFSENGCPLRDTLLVATCCSRQNVYVPNIFSPNDDGANDLFCINTIDRCRDFTLRIYDRWGSLLFVSKDADQCWDGRHQGKSMPSGVYTWFLEFYSDQFKRQDILKGSVTILR
ncbi:MAG: gliding motility-associated C-terminal domain-containing protein [Saprospiraceae bacterium]|nr:gliding motility-associated C-terminal domain-containing protein [Saprospiraceae bacterium]